MIFEDHGHALPAFWLLHRLGPMQVIPSAWLRLFNPREVNQLLSGGEGGGVDAEDMQRHATYSGGYSADSQTIKLFWKVDAPANSHSTQVSAQLSSQRGRTGVEREKNVRVMPSVQQIPC